LGGEKPGVLFSLKKGEPMGEIKSTLDLALERTRKMAISDKEKEEIKQKEILRKASSLFHRYMEDRASIDETLREIEKMEEKAGGPAKETLLTLWTDALSLSKENEKCLKGIEALKGPRVREVIQELRRLFARFREDKEKAKQEIRGQLTEELKKAKIYGSAVKPKIEGSEIWEERIGELEAPYQVRLKEMKRQIMTLTP
jgi:hypothetical protein